MMEDGGWRMVDWLLGTSKFGFRKFCAAFTIRIDQRFVSILLSLQIRENPKRERQNPAFSFSTSRSEGCPKRPTSTLPGRGGRFAWYPEIIAFDIFRYGKPDVGYGGKKTFSSQRGRRKEEVTRGTELIHEFQCGEMAEVRDTQNPTSIFPRKA